MRPSALAVYGVSPLAGAVFFPRRWPPRRMDRVEFCFAVMTVLRLAVLFGASILSAWLWLS